jgi:hypothetical protein
MHLAEDAIPERQVMGVCTHNELGNLHFATFKAFLFMSKSTISLKMVWKYLESSPHHIQKTSRNLNTFCGAKLENHAT